MDDFGVSQTALGKYMGGSRRTGKADSRISRWINGKSTVGLTAHMMDGLRAYVLSLETDIAALKAILPAAVSDHDRTRETSPDRAMTSPDISVIQSGSHHGVRSREDEHSAASASLC